MSSNKRYVWPFLINFFSNHSCFIGITVILLIPLRKMVYVHSGLAQFFLKCTGTKQSIIQEILLSSGTKGPGTNSNQQKEELGIKRPSSRLKDLSSLVQNYVLFLDLTYAFNLCELAYMALKQSENKYKASCTKIMNHVHRMI